MGRGVRCRISSLTPTLSTQTIPKPKPNPTNTPQVKKVLEVGIETADVDVLRRGLGALSVPVDRGMGLQVIQKEEEEEGRGVCGVTGWLTEC